MNETVEAARAISLIANISGYNQKLAVLHNNASNNTLREALRFIYNPYCKTGISAAKMNKVVVMYHSKKAKEVGASVLIPFSMAISYFKSHTTGSDADLSFAADFLCSVDSTYDASSEEGSLVYNVAKAIITQNLKIGITATSLNTVYGKDFIPKVGCMLGTRYDDVDSSKVTWPCIVTEKLDGIRRIIIKENGVCRAFSRSGHEDTGLVEIIAEAAHLPDNTVYDGELLAKGTFKDSIAQRQATSSLANGIGNKTGLVFNIFDMIPLADFYAGVSTDIALNRKILLGATFMDESIEYLTDRASELIPAFGLYQEFSSIKPVAILGYVHNMAEVEPIVSEIWKRGGEGVMLNAYDGLYEIKRSKKLLKVKHTEEHVLKVVDILEGTGKNEDNMGALVLDYNGSFLGVGSGFTDAQRADVWAHPDKYIGRMVEIETFGESTNAAGGKSLNCPIFKRFVGDEE